MSFHRLGRGTAAIAVLAVFMVQLGVPVSAATPSPIPADVRFVSTWRDPLTGLDWDRYQQYAAPLNVFVNGGQMIVIRNGNRVVRTAGAHFAGLRVTSQPRLTANEAISSAVAQAPRLDTSGTSTQSLSYEAQLRVEPSTGRQFYRVKSAAPGTLLYQDIDANTGAVLQSWSGLETDAPTGTGVKGDNKSLAGDAFIGVGNVLTSPTGSGGFKMVGGTRYVTVDDNGSSSQTNYPTTPMTDPDDSWVGARQVAAVDAQYYAAFTDNFYLTKFNVDLVGCLGVPIRSVVHFSHSYANAYWDPVFKVMVYGDGNGSSFSQMSGAQDVVSHELTHAVTTCHADLDYNRESGALNEAFSDIMATAAEFEFEEPTSSNCKREVGQSTCADWWLAEDLVIGGADHAIRSLAKPGVLGQPAHYSQRVSPNVTDPNKCNPFNDYCGVHTNSGIANHAFYLLAHGGRNARCAGPTDPKADCDVMVPGIGIDKAAHVFLNGWFALTNTATFCDARTASIEQAQLLVTMGVSGYTQTDVASVELAWDAVGVYCSGTNAFSVAAQTRSVAANPGGSVDVALNITRTSSTDPITFSISDPTPASASLTPPQALIGTTSVTLHLDVGGGAAPGTYPLVITATDGAATLKIPIVLLIDSDNPTAQVTSVLLAVGDTVAADGHVPLHVSWSTSDATSGVAGGALSVDANPVATGAGGPSTFAAADGTHVFQASATDLAGNSGTSLSLSVTKTSFQETAATYTKAWSTFTAGTPWGTTTFSKKKGATATLTFTGSDVAWISARGPKRGKAKVYIDGVLQTVVDLRTSNAKSSVIVFVATGLAAGPHTIKIYVNATAGRPRVDVDGFVVLAP